MRSDSAAEIETYKYQLSDKEYQRFENLKIFRKVNKANQRKLSFLIFYFCVTSSIKYSHTWTYGYSPSK